MTKLVKEKAKYSLLVLVNQDFSDDLYRLCLLFVGVIYDYPSESETFLGY